MIRALLPVPLLFPLLLAACAPAVPPASVPPPVAAAASPDSPAARAWGFASSDIPADPDVRWGVLPNGMKYALRANATPRGAVALRLAFDVGSLAEEDDQRGLAHFLEHMAFNGSTNLPEGAMIPLLERNGLAFGADSNASTGFEQTSYRLDLPRNDAALIDTGLMLLREIAGELTIAPEAVERERGVILSDRRARDSYALRNLAGQLGFTFAGTIVPDRMPIGTEQVIRTATARRLRDFYDAWYRPDRATLVIVGDMDVDVMEADVRRRFADWRGRGEAAARPPVGTPDFARARAADIFVHPAIAESVSLTWLRPWAPETDSRALRRQEALEGVARAIVSRRLSRIALGPDAPFSGASVSQGDAFDIARAVTVSATTRDGEWPRALSAIEQELRRARDHGFTEAEVAEQVATLRTALGNAAQGAGTRSSAALAAQLLAAADGRRVVATPAFLLALFEESAPAVTAADVTAALRASLAGYGEPLLRVTARAPVEGGPAALLAALDASAATPVAAAPARETVAFAYGDFGPPGAVVADDRIADLGIRRIRFANNVMLNIKRTDFEDDRIRMQVRIDGGGLLATRDDPTRVALAPLLTLGGLEAHGADELRSILAGRSVASSFTAQPDAFTMGASTTPRDFALQAQLFAAFLTHPGYRDEALDLFRRVLPQQYAAADATPAAVLARDAGAIVADGDPRLVRQPLETMLALGWDDGFRAAAADSLAHGAIEIGVVGAVDEDAAIAAIAGTFGALPERRADFAAHADARRRDFARDRSTRVLHHRGEADQAVTQTYWQARDDADLGEAMRLELLGEVLRLELTAELRERLGQSYSPGGGASLSSQFPGYGFLYASANVDVADVAAAEAAVDAIAARLREAPVDADLLDRARAPYVERLMRSRRQNIYWLGYVARAGSDPARLDRSRHAMDELRAATADDLLALARRYLAPDRALRIRALPAP